MLKDEFFFLGTRPSGVVWRAHDIPPTQRFPIPGMSQDFVIVGWGWGGGGGTNEGMLAISTLGIRQDLLGRKGRGNYEGILEMSTLG